MQKELLEEKGLRDAAAGKLDNIINLFKNTVKENSGNAITVCLGNRRGSGRPLPGGILTESAIMMKDDEPALVILYDPLELYYDERIAESGYSMAVIEEITSMLRDNRSPGAGYNPVVNPEKMNPDVLARQIGRWVLRFRGFMKLYNENRNFAELETFLNLECGIPPLYAVFDEANFDFKEGELKRLQEVYEGLKNMEEPSKRLDRALNAIRVANIMRYSPESNHKEALNELLLERFNRIKEVSEEIAVMQDESSPDDAAEHNEFMKRLVLRYRMPGNWSSVSETGGIF